MEFFKQNTSINFMGQRKYAAIFSLILFVVSISSIWFNGMKWGLDFTGGTQIELHYPDSANLPQIREQLEEAGFKDAVVKTYGSTRDVQVSFQPTTLATSGSKAKDHAAENKEVAVRVQQVLGAEVNQVNYIGPQVGEELVSKGVLALVVSLVATMIYIAMRFEFRFAISSTLALVHDPVLILGVFSFFHIEFDLIALVALLTVIGYSLNDTVVVFDRVRETFRKVRGGTPEEIMNLSINQTLSRTIMTSMLTLLAIISLYLFGGPVLHGFSVAFLVGILVGTYSSIYVAGALALVFGLKREDLLPTPKEEIDEMP